MISFKQKKELIVMGGLGNQLFIVFQACRLLYAGTNTIIFNTCEYIYSGRVDRPLVINQLVPGLLIHSEFKCSFTSKISYFIAKSLVKIRHAFPFLDDKSRLPGDGILRFAIRPFYYVYCAYFQHIDDESNLDIKALELMRTIFKKNPNEYQPNQLAIHIRRGDYLQKKHSSHGVVSMGSIVAEAVNAIKINNYLGVTIFTDSPELVGPEQFSSLGIAYVFDEGGDPVDVFFRMASHGGIVASNSSFSLWAGLIGSPKYFSIPCEWMPAISSKKLGLLNLRRYPCILL